MFAGPRPVAVLFDKPTLRTQTSFAAGIAELGGYPMIVDGRLAGIGKRESVPTRPGSSAGSRPRSSGGPSRQSDLEEMAEYAGVPVINALTDDFHPCQILADLQTIREHKGRLAGLTLAYVGDGANNMAHSYLLGGATGRAARPDRRPGRLPARRGDRRAGATASPRRPAAACRSPTRPPRSRRRRRARHRHLGLHGSGERRRPTGGDLRPYSLDAELLARAAADAIVLHCLPAYRGKEIAAEVIDGPQSVVWDEAENRRHVQKAILAFLDDQARAGDCRP